MGRNKRYATPAEKKQAEEDRYLAKHGTRRKHGKSGKGGRSFTKVRDGFFVAWDGEGKDTEQCIRLPDTLFVKRSHYLDPKLDLSGEGFQHDTHDHIMNLFACYGDSRYEAISSSAALSTKQILRFIGDNVQAYGARAIHVSFSFSYDTTHILRDLPREEIIKAHSPARERVSDYGQYGSFIIKYRPRKELYICELADPHKPYKRLPNGKTVLNKLWSVTIWDVWGFFQSSFEKALINWSIATPEQLDIIASGKAGRSSFSEWSTSDIETYNKLELVLLCDLMEKVRNATNALDLPLQRWDGAGAVAAAMYKKELPRDYIRNIRLSDSVQSAAYYAYAGGRSECIKQGTWDHDLFRYDINSAYPDAMRTIPDLQAGEWLEIKGGYYKECTSGDYIEDFALYHITWSYDEKTYTERSFFPFFSRDRSGTIFFPPFGENWVWGVEVRAAYQQGFDGSVNIHKAYLFNPLSREKPFSFIERYYKERLAIKRRVKEGTAEPEDNGRSLIIKLGLNSLYGKTVQKVGIEVLEGSIHYPPFYNIVIGSYITAYTRAKLYNKAMINPSAICLFATDGILSTEPLGSTETSEELGAWEVEKLDGLVLLQAGVYWTKSKGKWSEKSRGIDKATNEGEVLFRMEKVKDAWGSRQKSVFFSLRRFITSKWASLTEARYSLRGLWIDQEREIRLLDAGKKRTTSIKGKRWKELISTVANWSEGTRFNCPIMSEPRRIGGVDLEELEYEEEL